LISSAPISVCYSSNARLGFSSQMIFSSSLLCARAAS
jgi:hypothetical protein